MELYFLLFFLPIFGRINVFINALEVLCAQLTRELFAIAKFLVNFLLFAFLSEALLNIVIVKHV